MKQESSENIMKIFPLVIYKAKIGLTENERNILIKEVYAQESKSKNIAYKKKVSAWTGDTQGFEFLYSNKKFEKLFNLISINTKKYTETIGLNSDKVNFYFQRAWATISRNNENISPHEHQQSHISFAYYLKKNKGDGSLVFHNKAAHNEITPGLFKSYYHSTKDLFKVNYDNANSISFHPEVDEIYIFPSKSLHSTSQNKTSGERISISADISIIAKNSKNLEYLQTPIEKWTKF